MKFTPLLEKALEKAAVLHKDQKRKGGIIPYIVHPVAVAIILGNYTDDEEIITAGILHDTIEDTACTPEELEKNFGVRIKEIVLGVTENKYTENRPATWKEKKEGYLKKLREGSIECLMVCAADKISNFRSRMNGFRREGPSFENNFEAPQEEYTWFYEEIKGILNERLQNPILEEFNKTLGELKTLIKL